MDTNNLSQIEMLLWAELHSYRRKAVIRLIIRLVEREASDAFLDGIRAGTKRTLADAKRKRKARQQGTS